MGIQYFRYCKKLSLEFLENLLVDSPALFKGTNEIPPVLFEFLDTRG
jgi:hypothetical protein